MGSFVHEKADGMPVDDDFQDEIGRRPRSDRLSDNTVMVGVDQRLVQVQNEDFTFYYTWKTINYHPVLSGVTCTYLIYA